MPVEVIRQLMAAARQNSVRRVLVRTAGIEIDVEVAVERSAPARSAEPPGPPSDTSAGGPGLVEVLAPVVGVVRLTPGAEGAEEVATGTDVDPDDQVAWIEAMKMTTAVTAGCTGTVREVCVHDGDVVEFGQPLVRIEITGPGSDDAR